LHGTLRGNVILLPSSLPFTPEVPAEFRSFLINVTGVHDREMSADMRDEKEFLVRDKL
jgi:hypothetical protein